MKARAGEDIEAGGLVVIKRRWLLFKRVYKVEAKP